MKDYPLEKGFEEFVKLFNNYYYENNITSKNIEKSYVKKIIYADSNVINISNEMPEISFSRAGTENTQNFFTKCIRKLKKIIKKIIK